MANFKKIAQEVKGSREDRLSEVSKQLNTYRDDLIEIAQDRKDSGDTITVGELCEIASKALAEDKIIKTNEIFKEKTVNMKNAAGEPTETTLKQWKVTNTQIRKLFEGKEELLPSKRKRS